MSLSFERSAALIAEAANTIADGVNSNFRTGMAGGPTVFQRGEGPYLIDADGNRLIDYYCGMGSVGQDATGGLDVIGWNNLERLEARLAKGDVAGVIMEPAMCNQGAIQAAPGYLEGALAACRKHGAILIFDEVITGFRLGRSGAQGRFGVTPDLSIFAKAMANGFPVAAIVGRADLLDLFAKGGVLHGGTFNAQPVTMAAMVATQQALTP